MRTIGRRLEPAITFHGCARLLKDGARFNDEMHRLPTGNLNFVPKGIYRFKSHEDANLFDRECLAKRMAEIALKLH
jgi:hypothetical protein